MVSEAVTARPEVSMPLTVGGLAIDPAEFTAVYAGCRLRLTNKEFRLLTLLAANAGRLLTRATIADRVWDGDVRGRTIDIHIARLRRQLPPGAIETVIKVGYRLAQTL